MESFDVSDEAGDIAALRMRMVAYGFCLRMVAHGFCRRNPQGQLQLRKNDKRARYDGIYQTAIPNWSETKRGMAVS